LMDAYLPPNSDERTARPVVVYIDGEDKGNRNGIRFLKFMARRGYAGVAIDVRHTKGAYEEGSQQHVLDAVEDVRAAVRFINMHREGARVDSDRIALFGTAEGAITALAYGYVEDAQYEGESGNPGYRSDVRGIVSFAGTLRDDETGQDYTDEITGIDQPPLLVIHGTDDEVVPYENGRALFERAREVSLPTAMISLPESGHVEWSDLASRPYRNRTLKYFFQGLELVNGQAPEGCRP